MARYSGVARLRRPSPTGDAGPQGPAAVGPTADSPRAGTAPSGSPGFSTGRNWFSEHTEWVKLKSLGFRAQPGGAHLARTMMLAELGLVLQADPHPGSDDVGSLILSQNILRKRTGAGRRLSLRHLRELYGVGGIPLPISRAMMTLWVRAGEGRPVLAVLAALAREVLLRESAEIVLAAPLGAPMRAFELAAFFEQPLSRPLHAQNAAFAVAKLRVFMDAIRASQGEGSQRAVAAVDFAGGCGVRCFTRFPGRVWRPGATRLPLARCLGSVRRGGADPAEES